MKAIRFGMVAVLCVCGGAVAQAQSWMSASDGSWGAGGSWSGGAVPSGTAPLFFTNAHPGTVEVALDGGRSQNGLMTFGGGDWRVTPGTLPSSAFASLYGDLAVAGGSVATFAVPAQLSGAGNYRRGGAGEWRLEEALRLGSGQSLFLNEGVTRVAAGGTLYTGANSDVCVDGTACLWVDGGAMEARLVRMGQDSVPTGAVFRMTAGSVRVGGYGNWSLLIGYTAAPMYVGSARAEILGGSFVATGAVDNAWVGIGCAREGTLVVDGPTAVLDVGRVYFGWRNDERANYGTTNRLYLRNGGELRAWEMVARAESRGYSEAHLEAGGKLFTPLISSTAGSRLEVFWGGTVWTQSAPSNALFQGNVAVNLGGAGSTLVLPSGTAAWTVPVAGGGWLRKEGAGTLRMQCDQSAWTGGAVLAGGGLDVSGGALVVPLEVESAAAVLTASNAVLNALRLSTGTLAVEGDNVFISTLDVPLGESAVLEAAGTVTVLHLTGGGDLLASGGGTFYVLDDGGFTGNAAADPGTTWVTGYSEIADLPVFAGETVLALAQDTTVRRLSFVASGTLSVSGCRLTVGEIVLAPGVTGTLVFDDGRREVRVGTITGAGTLALPAGRLEFYEMGNGVSFDLLAGEVSVMRQQIGNFPAPPVFDTPPAFWVDASDSSSMSVSGSALTEWRDTRFAGGVYTNRATAGANVPTLLAPDGALNGKPAVKFASPASAAYSGMEWRERLTNIRSAFFVIGAQEGGGQLLGDTSRIDFLRGEVFSGTTGVDWPQNSFAAAIISQRYANANRDGLPSVMNGVTRLDGMQKNFGQTPYPSAGYHLVTLRTTGDTCAKAFASERIGTAYNDRSGCQRLGEVLIFTNAVSDAEIAATETYLSAKWFGGDIRVGRVRLGSPSARFHASNPNTVIIDTVVVPGGGIDVVTQVTNVKRIETVAITAPIVFYVPPEMVPGSASPSTVTVNEMRIENGATVSVNTTQILGTARLWTLSGNGQVTVAANNSGVQVPGLKTVAGEEINLQVSPGPLEVYAWAPVNGFLTVDGCTSLNIISVDHQGVSGIRRGISGLAVLPVTYSSFRKIGGNGQWTHESPDGSFSIDAFTPSIILYSGNLAFDLATAGRPFRVTTVRVVNNGYAMTRTGAAGGLQVNSQIQTEGGAAVTLDAALFTGGYLPTLRLSGSGATITGPAPLTMNTLRTEGYSGTITLTLASGAAVTASNLTHTAAATLRFPEQGGFTVRTLNPSDNCTVAVPLDRVTTVNALNVTASGLNRRLSLQGGVLRILDSVAANGYIVSAQGLIFPDGTALDLAQWDIRAALTLDVGAAGVVAVNTPVTLTNALTLANGALNVAAPLAAARLTLADGTAMSVAAPATLATLAGRGTVTLAAGAALDVLAHGGFDGTIINNGGTVATPSARVKIIPTEPVVAPTFWVDASQEGSFSTNVSGKLVWHDKRTARDGTPGLMYATALSNSLPPVLQNQLNGLPVVDFGAIGANTTDERGMVWNQRLTNVQAVHWVIGAQNGGGQILGDMASGGDIDWFRYSDNTTTPSPNYRYGDGGNDYRTPILPNPVRWGNRAGRMDYIHNGTAYLNGARNDGLAISNGFPAAGYHLVSARTTGPTYAAAFASERVGAGYGHRSGAQRLGEVLVYGVPLTETQNRENDIYLRWKWWGERLFEAEYRLATEDLPALRGSGVFSGARVLARELAPGAAGMSFGGSLHLDFYSGAAATGTVIRLDPLPAPGIAAVYADGDIHLSARGTIIPGEIRPGAFKVLEAGGAVLNAANIANWTIDLSAFPSTSGYSARLYVENNCVILAIRAKGTVILLR